MTVIYYCDHHACSDPPCLKYENYCCNRTRDPEHAKYGSCEDPFSEPERFILIGETFCEQKGGED